MGDRVVDVADETQCQTIVPRIDPARPRSPPRKVASACPTSEGISIPVKRRGIAKLSNHDARPARARFVSSSTAGRMCATIASTPATFG